MSVLRMFFDVSPMLTTPFLVNVLGKDPRFVNVFYLGILPQWIQTRDRFGTSILLEIKTYAQGRPLKGSLHSCAMNFFSVMVNFGS